MAYDTLRTVSVLLVLACFGLTPAALAAGGEPIDGYGPWRFGMTPEEVAAVERFGPYEPVRSTGGLETSAGDFDGETAHISFVFREDGLYHIQIWAYAGQDAAEAAHAFYRAYRHLDAKFGGAATHEGVLPAGLDEESFARILPPDLADDSEKVDLGKLEENTSFQVKPLKYHLHPVQPPDGARVYASLIKNPELGIYFVFVFYKLP